MCPLNVWVSTIASPNMFEPLVKIIEDDTHDNLIEITDGFYTNLWKIQTGEENLK